MREHPDEHMVQPKMVYISQTTEYGTYYTLEELKGIYECCQQNNLYLFNRWSKTWKCTCLERCTNFTRDGCFIVMFSILMVQKWEPYLVNV